MSNIKTIYPKITESADVSAVIDLNGVNSIPSALATSAGASATLTAFRALTGMTNAGFLTVDLNGTVDVIPLLLNS